MNTNAYRDVSESSSLGFPIAYHLITEMKKPPLKNLAKLLRRVDLHLLFKTNLKDFYTGSKFFLAYILCKLSLNFVNFAGHILLFDLTIF